MYTTETISGLTVADLQPGDMLLGLGESSIMPTAYSRLMVTAHPSMNESGTATVPTNVGEYTVDAESQATVDRPTGTPVILVSRRPALHRTILEFGTPVERRTPLDGDTTAPAITAAEWADAAMILFDSHLSQETIRALWDRDDIAPRRGVISVGTDLDDARYEGRARAVRAMVLLMLPDHARSAAATIRTAHDRRAEGVTIA